MNWLRITETANIPVREGRAVAIGGREIAIFNLGETFVAMENRCPHRGGPLADGIVSATGEALTVTCPLHNWRIAVDCGQVVKPSGESVACVRTYPVKVENGIIAVHLGPAQIEEETAA